MWVNLSWQFYNLQTNKVLCADSTFITWVSVEARLENEVKKIVFFSEFMVA